MLSKTKKNNEGQSLIDIIIALAIFSILSTAIFTAVSLTLNLVSFNRSRTTARHIAQAKIEFLRNLPYDDVGTTGGIPSGGLPQEETQIENGLKFNIKTTIIYIDDEFDDTAPTDLLPTDYKRARVEVSWEGLSGGSKNSPVVMLTDISPKGIETTEGGGTLSVLVFDANGNPVSQADVIISAPSLNPAINLTIKSNSSGRVLLPGAPECISCYRLTVTKAGYSTEQTYSTAEVANPNKPDQTVLEGNLTEVSFAIDRLSILNIATKDSRENAFATLPNTSFEMRGSKTIGTDTNAQPVYKYDKTLTTNSSGELTINDLEWDSYTITRYTAQALDISGINPLQPLVVNPSTETNLAISFVNHSTNSLLVSFLNSADQLIASVSAHLTFGGFDKTILSGQESDPDFGQAFFTNLSSGNHTFSATASGYLDHNSSIQISGQNQEQVVLTEE